MVTLKKWKMVFRRRDAVQGLVSLSRQQAHPVLLVVVVERDDARLVPQWEFRLIIRSPSYTPGLATRPLAVRPLAGKKKIKEQKSSKPPVRYRVRRAGAASEGERERKCELEQK